MNIDTFDNSFGDPMPQPRISKPLDQEIGEVFVSNLLWHLGSGSSADFPQTGAAWDTTAIPLDKMWAAFHSAHLTSSSKYTARGYKTPDVVDMLDGLQCGGATSSEESTSSRTTSASRTTRTRRARETAPRSVRARRRLQGRRGRRGGRGGRARSGVHRRRGRRERRGGRWR